MVNGENGAVSESVSATTRQRQDQQEQEESQASVKESDQTTQGDLQESGKISPGETGVISTPIDETGQARGPSRVTTVSETGPEPEPVNAPELQRQQKQQSEQARQQGFTQRQRQQLSQFAQSQGVSRPETARQYQILQTLRQTRQAEQGGFTQAERRANLDRQQAIEQASAATEAREQEQRIESAIERVQSAPQGATFRSTEDGERLTRNQLLERLRGEQEQAEQFIGDRFNRIGALEASAQVRERQDPMQGRTSKNVLQSLNNKELLGVSALTAFQPEGVRFAAAGLRGDKQEQQEAVESVVRKTRTGELTPTRAAGRSLLSLPGTAAASEAVGAATIGGAGALVSRGAISAGTARTGLQALGAGLIGLRAKNIGTKFAQGKEQKATEEALRFGTGLAGFTLGAQAAGGIAAITSKTPVSSGRTAGDFIPSSQRNIVESDLPGLGKLPGGRGGLQRGPRTVRAFESGGQRFVPEQVGARETGTTLEKPGATAERFKTEELKILAQRGRGEFLGRTEEGRAVFSRERAGTREFTEVEETPLSRSTFAPDTETTGPFRTRKGQAQLEPPRFTERLEQLRTGRTVEPETAKFELPEFNTVSRTVTPTGDTGTTTTPTSFITPLSPVTASGAGQQQQQQVEPLQDKVPQLEVDNSFNQYTQVQSMQEQQPGTRTRTRTEITNVLDTGQQSRQQQQPALDTPQTQRFDQSLNVGIEMPSRVPGNPGRNFQLFKRSRGPRDSETTPTQPGLSFDLPDVGPSKGVGVQREPSRRVKDEESDPLNLDVLTASQSELRFGEATVPTSPKVLETFRKQEAGAGPVAALPSLEQLSGSDQREAFQFF